MHITGMTIGGIPPFTEPVEFEFDERVNVFIGPNATGKSTALSALSHSRESELLLRAVDPWSRPHRDQNIPLVVRSASSGDWPTLEVYIPAMRLAWTHSPIKHQDYVNGLPRITNAIDMITALNLPLDEHGDVFDPELVHSLATMIYRMESEEPMEHETAQKYAFEVIPEKLMEAMKIAGDCGSEIRSLATPPYGNVVTFGGDTVFMDGRFLPVGALSLGTQGPYLWILDLAFRMVRFYQFVPDWHKKPAILLIDEIENHLHPTWQRRVIPALLDHFPGLQIFATTHSPFVVAGLRAGQVHMLNRDEDGVVRATTNTEAIVGWTADEILRTMMGVDDPTDDETARNAAELRRLRDEGPRDTEDAEAERQARMQDLRRLVNRDLLAGGPREAQRELFEQQFAEALEKYLQSPDLNQDNG